MAEDRLRPPKQHHTARRIYHRLKEEQHYSGGESTVREYVHQNRPKPCLVFIPLTYDPAEDAQVDFGEAQVIMNGRPLTVQLFVGWLCFSKIPFLSASPNQQQEALFEGHKAAFSFFGGVPRNVWYDRTGLVVDVVVTQATGTAERDTALDMLERVPGKRRITLGADKGYDTRDFVTACRKMNVTPHLARRQWSILGVCPSNACVVPNSLQIFTCFRHG